MGYHLGIWSVTYSNYFHDESEDELENLDEEHRRRYNIGYTDRADYGGIMILYTIRWVVNIHSMSRKRTSMCCIELDEKWDRYIDTSQYECANVK